ncbi:MAG: DUF1028 domain-containing protein [Actinomycetota bacterium]|nr:DUF1028 domain-containing protein [Actinomycetota bacterium]
MDQVSSVTTAVLRRAAVSAAVVAVAAVATAATAGASWAVIAVEVSDGEIGYAVAGCGELPATALSAGGVVVIDGADDEDAAGLLERLADGADPETVLRDAGDDVVAGAVAGSGRGAAVGRASSDAGRRATADGRLVVIGTDLDDTAVLDRAVDAFVERGDLRLGDRLLRALEAGSAAGGDARCSTDDVTQTADRARLAIAGGDGVLEVEAREGALGANALVGLRDDYEAEREARYGACEDCDLGAIDVPEGDVPGTSRRIASFIFTFGTLIVFLVIYRRWRTGLDDDD